MLNNLSDSDGTVIVTRRGRASAVLISAERYIRIEEDLEPSTTYFNQPRRIYNTGDCTLLPVEECHA